MPIDDPYSKLDAELALARRRISELDAELARVRAAEPVVRHDLASDELERRRSEFDERRIRRITLTAQRNWDGWMAAEKRALRLDTELADLHAECARLRADCTRAAADVREAGCVRADCDRTVAQLDECRALLVEALRRHDATPLGEWARAARAVVADEPHAAES